MADQIFAPGPMATPAKYQVPGSSVIVPIAVQALLNGSGASGAFVPTLIFRSQAGHVIARVPTETTIAAGGSAEVSWFPGVKEGGGAASSTVAWAIVKGTGTIIPVTGNAGSGSPTVLTWDQFNFTEDGSGVFSFDPLFPEYIMCSASPEPGYFLTHATFEHDNSVPSLLTFGDVRTFFTSEAPAGSGPELANVKQVVSADQGVPGNPNAAFIWGLEAFWASRGDTTPIGFYVTVENFNAGAALLNAVPVKFSVSLVAA